MRVLWGAAFGAGGAALGSLGWVVGFPSRSPRVTPARLAGLAGLVAGVLAGALAVVSAAYWRAAFLAPLVAVLAACGSIDPTTGVIPNRLTYAALAAYAVAITATGIAGGPLDLTAAAVGLAAFGGALLAVAFAVPRGMGMGDVKLAALIGLVLGAFGLRPVATAAAGAFLGGAVASILLLASGAGRKATLPFGPFLAIGGAVGSFLAVRLLT